MTYTPEQVAELAPRIQTYLDFSRMLLLDEFVVEGLRQTAQSLREQISRLEIVGMMKGKAFLTEYDIACSKLKVLYKILELAAELKAQKQCAENTAEREAAWKKFGL